MWQGFPSLLGIHSPMWCQFPQPSLTYTHTTPAHLTFPISSHTSGIYFPFPWLLQMLVPLPDSPSLISFGKKSNCSLKVQLMTPALQKRLWSSQSPDGLPQCLPTIPSTRPHSLLTLGLSGRGLCGLPSLAPGLAGGRCSTSRARTDGSYCR